jgi:hypothetical protein
LEAVIRDLTILLVLEGQVTNPLSNLDIIIDKKNKKTKYITKNILDEQTRSNR